MDNVTLTAHVASASARFDEARKRRVGYELSLVLSGLWPVSCVNPSVLQNTSLRRWQPVSMDRGPNSSPAGNARFPQCGSRAGQKSRSDRLGPIRTEAPRSPANKRRERQNKGGDYGERLHSS